MTVATGELRVLVCEDSATYAESLAGFLGADAALRVVGVCTTPEQALRALPRLTPDLVTIDLELPGMGGIRAIEAIMRSHPVPVLALSAGARSGSEKAAQALAAGALEALPKSHLHLNAPQGPAAVALRHRLRRLARTRVERDSRASVPAAQRHIEPLERDATVVAVCASTGGPRALRTVLSDLPPDFPLPVLVVQHMAHGFIGGLVRWLEQRVPLPVGVARESQRATPGIWFPPDDAHLMLRPSMRLALDPVTVAGAHRPSADVLLRSVAVAAGSSAIAVVLTGMGHDGAAGAAAVRRAKGRVIAQDEESSVVFGMPRAAAEAGATTVLPVAEIAGAIRTLATPEGRT